MSCWLCTSTRVVTSTILFSCSSPPILRLPVIVVDLSKQSLARFVIQLISLDCITICKLHLLLLETYHIAFFWPQSLDRLLLTLYIKKNHANNRHRFTHKSIIIKLVPWFDRFPVLRLACLINYEDIIGTPENILFNAKRGLIDIVNDNNGSTRLDLTLWCFRNMRATAAVVVFAATILVITLCQVDWK